MKNFVSVTSSGTGTIHTLMTTEALKKVAASLEQRMKETPQNTEEEDAILSVEEIAAADVVIFAPEIRVDKARFAKALIEAAAEFAGVTKPPPPPPPPGKRKFVALTVSSDGIYHNFLSAISLRKAAKALGYDIKVETQGPFMVTGDLTSEEIAAADAVVIAADTKVDISRFLGKSIYFTDTKQATQAGEEVLTNSLTSATASNFPLPEESNKTIRATAWDAYKHLLTGISYMLPMVTVGGLSTALAFTFSDIYSFEHKEGTLGWALNLIGSGFAFNFLIAILSGFIAFSISGRSALVPGFIGGGLAHHFGAGFLGGIAAGFLAGFLTKFLTHIIRLPDSLKGLKSTLILPFVSSLLIGLTMIYLIAPPIYLILHALTQWLCGMQGVHAFLLGMLLGGMMAFDMGGPVNKTALTFAVGLLASKIYTPMAAVMIGGMTPPLGIATAAWLFKNRFDVEDREAAASTFILGLSFVTEGAIPFALKDPLRVIPALIVGSATGGAIAMFCNVELLVPHGGLFAILIPGAVRYLGVFCLALLIGTLITANLLFMLKPSTQINVGAPLKCNV